MLAMVLLRDMVVGDSEGDGSGGPGGCLQGDVALDFGEGGDMRGGRDSVSCGEVMMWPRLMAEVTTLGDCR